MNPFIVLAVIGGYFLLLILISRLTAKGANSDTFFTANRKSPWYVVAFGMIGATLSGVTFISVPGEVGNSAFSYFQFVLGNLVGYWIVAGVLLPMYYRMNLVSIYGYLEERFGPSAYKTGSFFFLLSRTIGAAFRLYLVAGVLQLAFFDAFGVPFWITVMISILLIWVYTYRGGIKTIVWTDTLQTTFLILAVVLTIHYILNHFGWSIGEAFQHITDHPDSKIFHWGWRSGNNFFKQFFAGMFVTVVMVGLDQDMMQKNLTCRNVGEARKNMIWFSASFVIAVALFLGLGVLLYIFAAKTGTPVPERTDDLYPLLALTKMNLSIGIAFLLGITAAAYSSADSALASLTTAFCVDFLKFQKRTDVKKEKERKLVHMGFSVILFFVIVIFRVINDESVVVALFKVAGYTYGPLLGLFAFGMFTKYKVDDRAVPYLAVAAPLISWAVDTWSEQLLFGYRFGFEILILNGGLMFLGLLLFRKKYFES
ncbi:sodium:solute symporter [Prolixibacter denitrificans]|uniref:SSS family transporter n=1 Tax=Prolixibacter denitrificans TaxID=1541063 RepID=A0A2P8C929_9BACT|nr:sodium:solute symporter [Prolixibacter denitrificans]PSK81461.1 SSS family transporter [Prolixibacter denitrificans]GET21069.1 sodium:solute symporter [Prolixibacter denitrificans]